MKTCPLCAQSAPAAQKYCSVCSIPLVDSHTRYYPGLARSRWLTLPRLLGILLVGLATLIALALFWIPTRMPLAVIAMSPSRQTSDVTIVYHRSVVLGGKRPGSHRQAPAHRSSPQH